MQGCHVQKNKGQILSIFSVKKAKFSKWIKSPKTTWPIAIFDCSCNRIGHHCSTPIGLILSSTAFQCTLLVEIRKLVAWLMSNLLLKIECQETHIYMKTECLQTKWDTVLLKKERKRPWEQRWKELALFKSLIYARVERCSWMGTL